MPKAQRTSRTVFSPSSPRPRRRAICTIGQAGRLAFWSSRPSAFRRRGPRRDLVEEVNIWSRNHGSILVDSNSSSRVAPPQMACWTWTRRPRSDGLMASTSARVSSARPGARHPSGTARRPCRSSAAPFRRASVKERPIAMASPTAFIDVVRLGSAAGNFSNVNRGTLTPRSRASARTRPGSTRDVVAESRRACSRWPAGGDLRDREARRLRGQRRRTRHARVHLDDDDAAGLRVDRELDVTAARIHAHAADDGDADVAQRCIRGRSGSTPEQP